MGASSSCWLSLMRSWPQAAGSYVGPCLCTNEYPYCPGRRASHTVFRSAADCKSSVRRDVNPFLRGPEGRFAGRRTAGGRKNRAVCGTFGAGWRVGGICRSWLSSPSKVQVFGGAFGAELGAPDIASHCRQATMPGVPHDLLVGDAVLIGGCHEACPHPVRGHRLPDCSADAGLGGPLLKDLPNGVRVEPPGMYSSLAIDFPEDRARP